MLNPTLLQLARHRVWKDASSMEKIAVVPPGGGDPSQMMGGGDPSQGGGAPPGGGGMPPGMDPSQMGAAMGGGMPPGGAPAPAPAPQMAGQMPQQGQPMMGDPAQAAAMGAAPPKLKPEQMMQMLDFRLYNMQQMLTAMMNAQGITLPPGALVTPPGSPTPVAEAAVPGGPNDPGQAANGGNSGGGGGGDGSGGGGGSAINPIEAIQGASPQMAKSGGVRQMSFSEFIEKMADDSSNDDDEDAEAEGDDATDEDGHDDIDADSQASFDPGAMGEWMNDNTKSSSFSGVGQPFSFFNKQPAAMNAAAVAAMLRARTMAGVS